MFRHLAVFMALLALASGVQAQFEDWEKGPVIKNFGPVFPPPEGSYNLDPDTLYKVSMDVSGVSEFPGEKNPYLESAARFLNMHARTGIPPENIQFAIVVHGRAAQDLLTNDAYHARYNEDNANAPMLDELKAAGVPVYLCSQSVGLRGYKAEELHPAVVMAVSAMTVHVRLQQEGYTLVPR